MLEVYYELLDFFRDLLAYHSMLALCDRPVLAMVNISALELYQLLQYSYVCSSVMFVQEGGGSARDARVSLTNVDVVSRLDKSCWMSTIPTVCRGSRQVVTVLSESE